MSDQLPAGGAAAPAPHPLRVLALSAAGLGVCALAAAAFVLSYAGLHAIALQAGVSTRLARGYPLIVDVLLVIVLAAVLSLRGAGWPTKLLAWTCLLVLLAAAAAAGALHAVGHRLPHRPAAITAAVLPWALLLIAVVLLLAMVRQLRLRRAAAAPRWEPQVPPPVSNQPLIPGFAPAAAAGPDAASPAPGPSAPTAPNETTETMRLVVPRQVAAANAADAAPAVAAGPEEAAASPDPDIQAGGMPEPAGATPEPTGGTPEQPSGGMPEQAGGTPEPAGGMPEPADDEPRESDLAIDAEPVPDDPSSDEAPGPGVWSRAVLEPAEDETSGTAEGPRGEPASGGPASDEPPSDGPSAAEEEPDPEMPVFHRMWSAPTPPADGDES
jgi:hypothetical protein